MYSKKKKKNNFICPNFLRYSILDLTTNKFELNWIFVVFSDAMVSFHSKSNFWYKNQKYTVFAKVSLILHDLSQLG